MPGLNKEAQKFLRAYSGQYPSVEIATKLALEAVERAVRGSGAFVHAITARAKTPDSLRSKLRRKRYRYPAKQLTDLIGVRVITYYRDSVDKIVARLRQEFEINSSASTDKRLALGLRDFGYRSVHLIVRLKPTQILTPDHKILGKQWFEIQIRSILEHAWAEIEHEAVYKSGIKHPPTVIRRFASLAGSLELLDNEFLALRETHNAEIDEYRQVYQRKEAQRIAFDVARLLGFLEHSRPEGHSWRRAESEGNPFTASLDVCCVDALKAAGLGTPASLGQLLKSRKFHYAVGSFATSQGIAPARVSHLAVVVIAIAIKNSRMVQRHFPEIIYDPAIDILIRRRAR